MAHHHDPFAPAVQTAHDWLRAVADGLDTDDYAYANRALRAWMHTVRDRIGVVSSAHLAAQLPEILRGAYYEGWVPSHVPMRHGTDEFVTQFAREAGIERAEVGPVAGSITAVLSELFSPGQLNRIFAVLPMHLYGVLCGTRPAVEEISDLDGWPIVPETAPDSAETDRLAAVENRVRALADAVSVLTGGLEPLLLDEPRTARMTSAVERVHRILHAIGLGSDSYAKEH